MTDTHGFGYTLVAIGIVLFVALVAWAIVRNRQAGGRRRTEQATRDLYRQENRDAHDDRAV